jgi:HAD superfamily hydrolase (TIGR01549 family)
LLVPIFDLDGTLLDSDAALSAPFVALGIDPDRVEFGLLLVDACERLGITVDDYVQHYDVMAALPFPDVEDLVSKLDRWAVCSNKLGASGRAELERLGWKPDVVMFADDFGGPKQLAPVLDAMHLAADEIIFVGDTSHDREAAQASGCRFALAGWNPRASAVAGDLVLARPLDLLHHLGHLGRVGDLD